jgi:hypothetical protein
MRHQDPLIIDIVVKTGQTPRGNGVFSSPQWYCGLPPKNGFSILSLCGRARTRYFCEKIPYMALLVNMIPYMTLKTFYFLYDTRHKYFALYDTLVHHMTYKDAITPSAIHFSYNIFFILYNMCVYT